MTRTQTTITKTNHYYLGALAALLALAMTASLLALVVAQPAQAAFPGANGKIVFESFRDGYQDASVIAAVAGIVITVFEARGGRFRWLPSPAALGFGLILPGLLTVPLAIGGILGWIWSKRSPVTYDRYRFTLVAGLIAGDALISGVIVPILASLGVPLGS